MSTRPPSLPNSVRSGVFAAYSGTMESVSWLKRTPLVCVLVIGLTTTLGAVAGSITCSLRGFPTWLESSGGFDPVDVTAAGRCFIRVTSPAKEPSLFVERVLIVFSRYDDTLKTAAVQPSHGFIVFSQILAAAVLFSTSQFNPWRTA